MIYQGTTDFNGNDTLTVLSTDNTSGTALTDSDTVAISVTAVADAPINTVPGAQTVGEDTPLTITGISVSDANDQTTWFFEHATERQQRHAGPDGSDRRHSRRRWDEFSDHHRLWQAQINATLANPVIYQGTARGF